MTRPALVVLVAALVAGCGASKHADVPAVALLTGVTVDAASVRFEFRSAPQTIHTHFTPQVAEAGSGRAVPLKGRAFLVVSFSAAATGTADANGVTLSYTGPKRLEPRTAGPVQEVAKAGDFEAQLDWAIGLDRRRAPTVTRDGSTVTVAFGGT